MADAFTNSPLHVGYLRRERAQQRRAIEEGRQRGSTRCNNGWDALWQRETESGVALSAGIWGG